MATTPMTLPCRAASCHPRTGPHETAVPRVNRARREGLPLRTVLGLGTAGRDRWAQVAPGRTLSPSSRNRSPERGAGDVQRRGDGFSHALFPCPNPSPCSTRGVISDDEADSELSGSAGCASSAPGGTTRCPEGRRAPQTPTLPFPALLWSHQQSINEHRKEGHRGDSHHQSCPLLAFPEGLWGTPDTCPHLLQRPCPSRWELEWQQ